MRIEDNSSTSKFFIDMQSSLIDYFSFKGNLSRWVNRRLPVSTKKYIESVLSVYTGRSISLATDKTILDSFTGFKFHNAKCGEYSIRSESLYPDTLIKSSHLKVADKFFKSYNDYMVIDSGISIPLLCKGDTVITSLSMDEVSETNEIVSKASGSILILGLGLGYQVIECMRNTNIESITVIESSIDTISLFRKHVLPQADSRCNLNIIQGNIFDYYTDSFTGLFDYVLVCILNNFLVGEQVYRGLLASEVSHSNIKYLNEGSILEDTRMYLGMYLSSIFTGDYINRLVLMPSESRRKLKAVNSVLTVKNTLSSYEQLITLINDSELLHRIIVAENKYNSN